MIPVHTLTITEAMHADLKQHLFPGDGKEAAAILICTRVPGLRSRLLAWELIRVPHEDCSYRDAHALTWPSDYIEKAIDIAEPAQLSIILVHSHPTGHPDFSAIDNLSDQKIIPSIFEACGDLHGTAVMLPAGTMFGRIYTHDMVVSAIDLISIPGINLQYFWGEYQQHLTNRPMAFTGAMTNELSRLTACVIGVSGTGSIVAEQMCRLGFGRVILIDHDKVESKNLNRIINTNKEDAIAERSKVEVFAEKANAYRDEPYVTAVKENVFSRKAVIAAAQADVLFCCVDTHRGRSIADLIAATFLLPLFEVGVTIPTRDADGKKVIDEAIGRIDYVFPGGSSLFDRGVYTSASLQAEALAEADPAAYMDQVKRGYIEGLPEQAPSVITLNMRAASACVMEFIARAYPFRHENNEIYARTMFMLAEAIEEFSGEKDFKARVSRNVARGAEEPLLNLPSLANKVQEK